MECVEIVPGFVAEMKDVDLKLEAGAGLGEAVTLALDQWPVVVFRGQDVDDEVQLRLAASLGRLRSDRPHMGTVGNVNDDGTLISEEDQRQYVARGTAFGIPICHFDGCPTGTRCCPRGSCPAWAATPSSATRTRPTRRWKML